MYGYNFNPYTSGPSYAYGNPYINPYEAALAQERARRAQEQREAYARALAQQERERRARQAAARRNPYSFGLGGFYDPEEDEEYDYGYAEPALKRQRELDDAARIRAMYNRAARRGDEIDVDVPQPAPRKKTPSPQRTSTSIPIRVHSSALKPPSPKPTPVQPSRSSPTPKSTTPPPAPQIQIEPTQAAHTAASQIQRTWRRHAALRQLQSLRAKFGELMAKFEEPRVLEYTLKDARGSEDGLEEVAEVETGDVPFRAFVRPSTPADPEEETPVVGEEGDADMKEEGWEEVDGEAKKQDAKPRVDNTTVPPLAYTSSTRPVLAQNEALLRLLNALDAVPSWGDSAVREARKQLAKDVEGEAARLDAWWKAVWRERGAGAKVKRVRA